MPGEVVQDGLPSLPLLIHRVFGFSIERDAYRDAICAWLELDFTNTVAERIRDQLVGHNLGVGSGEVKPKAAIFGLHARCESATRTQIDAGFGCMPVIRRGIPQFDVVWRCIGPPDLADRSFDDGFNGDFHGSTCRELLAVVPCGRNGGALADAMVAAPPARRTMRSRIDLLFEKNLKSQVRTA